VRVRVIDSIGDLAADLARIPVKAATDLPPVVQRSVREGNALAQSFARAASGPHGKNYYKRITSEMTSPLVGEYGPHGNVVGNAVGAGWRSGPPNTDLEKSQDVIGPKFANTVGETAEGWFW
tara:strand:+ start:6947 stop:7312 length:366 start_codon:yes stop_codon:yes gene_type:complete